MMMEPKHILECFIDVSYFNRWLIQKDLAWTLIFGWRCWLEISEDYGSIWEELHDIIFLFIDFLWESFVNKIHFKLHFLSPFWKEED